MSPKYEIGQKVIVIDGSDIDDYTGGFVNDMKEWVGRVATIESVTDDWGDGKIGYSVEECGWTFDERGLKDVIYDDEIVIRRVGTNVVASYPTYNIKSEREMSPKDDFNDVVKSAISELFRKKPKFRIGDIVVGNESADDHYSITVKGWLGRVVHVNAEDNEIDVESLEDKGTIYHSFDCAHFDKAEPYSGKVVCVRPSSGFTVGKVYTVGCDGCIKDDSAKSRGGDNIITLERLNAHLGGEFIELIEE